MTGFVPRRLVSEGAALDCLHLSVPAARAGIVWSFGSGGGFHGPAGGLYDRLGEALVGDGIASLQVAYRRPGELRACVAGVLTGVAWLAADAAPRMALVEHSFGGAVVNRAGVASPAVATLSSQSHGTDGVAALVSRPLFLLHGTDDEVLPVRCSEDIHRRAKEPKVLLRPACRHGPDECRDTVDRELAAAALAIRPGPLAFLWQPSARAHRSRPTSWPTLPCIDTGARPARMQWRLEDVHFGGGCRRAVGTRPRYFARTERKGLNDGGF